MSDLAIAQQNLLIEVEHQIVSGMRPIEWTKYWLSIFVEQRSVPLTTLANLSDSPQSNRLKPNDKLLENHINQARIALSGAGLII